MSRETPQETGAESATSPENQPEAVITQNDIASRLELFNAELKGICAKYQIALIATPYIEGGVIKAMPQVIDNTQPSSTGPVAIEKTSTTT